MRAYVLRASLVMVCATLTGSALTLYRFAPYHREPAAGPPVPAAAVSRKPALPLPASTPVGIAPAAPPAAEVAAARPRREDERETFVDFDPGFGEMIPGGIDDDVELPYEEIVREEELLAARADSQRPGAPADFAALGFESAEALESSLRRVFGISAERYVEVREIEEDGERFVTIDVAPVASVTAEGRLPPE
jgi:hypothetical protein